MPGCPGPCSGVKAPLASYHGLQFPGSVLFQEILTSSYKPGGNLLLLLLLFSFEFLSFKCSYFLSVSSSLVFPGRKSTMSGWAPLGVYWKVTPINTGLGQRFAHSTMHRDLSSLAGDCVSHDLHCTLHRQESCCQRAGHGQGRRVAVWPGLGLEFMDFHQPCVTLPFCFVIGFEEL